MKHAIAFAAILATSIPAAARAQAGAPAETSEVAPVWRLDITQTGPTLTPRLVTNAFADPARRERFPLRDLPLLRVIEGPPRRIGSDQVEVEVDIEVARLPVGSDGRIASGSVRAFVAHALASVDPLTLHTAFLCVMGAGAWPSWCDTTLDFCADLYAIPGDVYAWEVSPDGTWGVAHTTAETGLLSRGHASAVVHLRQVYLGAFSRDGSKYVASSSAPESVGVLGERWWVFGRDGSTVREGAARPTSIEHLEFAPDGKSILVAWRSGGSYRVNLGTGKEEPLPAGWWDDEHQVSADGRTDLRVRRTGHGATVRLFDCSDPTRPVALGDPLVLDDPVEAAAVSADGGRVALQEGESPARRSRPSWEGEGESMRVAVYDRRLQRRVVLLRHTQRGGLLFAGHHLVVGTGPASRVTRFQSSTGTLVYDLSGLMP